MLPRVLNVDDDGLHLDRGFDGSLDVHFDGAPEPGPGQRAA